MEDRRSSVNVVRVQEGKGKKRKKKKCRLN
jgi:hypothetical protein